MSTNEPRPGSDREPKDAGDVIKPLEGEAGIPSVVRPTGVHVSRKGIVAVALLALSLIAVSAVSINRALSSKKDGEEVSKRLGDRPAAAGGDARRLDMTLPRAASQYCRAVKNACRRSNRRPATSGPRRYGAGCPTADRETFRPRRIRRPES